MTDRRRPTRLATTLAVLLALVSVGSVAFVVWRQPWLWPGRPGHLQRPYGMAPVAFRAFVRACYRAHVNPDRITQTIGDAAPSKGYHLRDGVLHIGGQSYDYCAATDLHAGGLSQRQIDSLLHQMALQGFACWYRHGRNWLFNEHIHAVYAHLPMKPQLRRQVAQFLAEGHELGPRIVAWRRRSRLASLHSSV